MLQIKEIICLSCKKGIKKILLSPYTIVDNNKITLCDECKAKKNNPDNNVYANRIYVGRINDHIANGGMRQNEEVFLINNAATYSMWHKNGIITILKECISDARSVDDGLLIEVFDTAGYVPHLTLLEKGYKNRLLMYLEHKKEAIFPRIVNQKVKTRKVNYNFYNWATSPTVKRYSTTATSTYYTIHND